MKGRNTLRGGLNELPAINRNKLLVKVHAWFCSLIYAELYGETKHFFASSDSKPSLKGYCIHLSQ